MYQLSLETRSNIIRALVDGNSIRGTARIVGVDRETVMNLGVAVGDGCAVMHDRLVRGVAARFIELDEIWSFIGKKAKRVEPGFDPWFYGDAYTFVALDAETKLGISYLTARRTPADTQSFVFDLRDRVTGRPQISTDGWVPYVNSICDAFEGNVDHGVMVKSYESDASNNAPAARRYSPGRVISADRQMVTGNPIDDRINTAYVERQNLTMRMCMRRFTRLTNGFSRKRENLVAAVALHFGWYNWVRIHETLRVTPAMAAGLSTRVWSIEELVSFALSMPRSGEKSAA